MFEARYYNAKYCPECREKRTLDRKKKEREIWRERELKKRINKRRRQQKAKAYECSINEIAHRSSVIGVSYGVYSSDVEKYNERYERFLEEGVNED